MKFKKIIFCVASVVFVFVVGTINAETTGVIGMAKFVAPANNTIVAINAEVDFKWSVATSTAEIAGYEIQYFKNKAYAGNPDYSASLATAEKKIAFADSGIYYLRVRAKSASNNYGAWSNGAENIFKISVKEVDDDDLLPISNVLAKKAECMKGNWNKEAIAGGPFKNQGECVAHWNHQIHRHVQNIVNAIQTKMQELTIQVKKQNDEAVSKGYANWGQYMKSQKAHQKGND